MYDGCYCRTDVRDELKILERRSAKLCTLWCGVTGTAPVRRQIDKYILSFHLVSHLSLENSSIYFCLCHQCCRKWKSEEWNFFSRLCELQLLFHTHDTQQTLILVQIYFLRHKNVLWNIMIWQWCIEMLVMLQWNGVTWVLRVKAALGYIWLFSFVMTDSVRSHTITRFLEVTFQFIRIQK